MDLTWPSEPSFLMGDPITMCGRRGRQIFSFLDGCSMSMLDGWYESFFILTQLAHKDNAL